MERHPDRCKMRWSLFFLAGFFLNAIDCLTEKEKEEKETLFRHPTQFTGEGREHKELPEDYWKIHSSPPTPIWLGQPNHHHSSPKSLLFIGRRRKRQVGDEDGKWPKEKIENQPTLFNDKDDYDSFFRNEYYRILAQSFASSRKKREVRKRVEDAKIMNRLSSSQQKLNDVEKRATKKHKSVAMHIGSNDKENLQNEYASEDTGIVQPKNAGFRPLPGFSAHPVSNSDLPFGKWKFFDDEKHG